jgi:hypothetical protein
MSAVRSDEECIRVGVTLDGRRVARWKCDVLRGLREQEGVELALVVLTAPQGSGHRGPGGRLLRLYCAADRLVFAREHDPLRTADVSGLIEGVPTADRGRGGVPADVGRLDVGLALGGEDDPLLADARHGVWTYRHGDGREARDDLPYLRDIRAGRLASQVALVRRSDGRVLASSAVRTDLVSLQRVRARALLRCRHFAARCLRDLRDGVAADAGPQEPEVARVATGPPGAGAMVSVIARIFLRLLGHRIRNALWQEQWSFAVRPPDPAPPPASFAAGRMHRPPRGRDWADPFPLRVDGRSWVFFEEVPWRGGHGHISVGELGAGGALRDVRVALATQHHLSYPFVFTHDGESYLLPESRASSTTTLYRARALPDQWEPVGVLADVALYDPTLLLQDGRWWLFGTVAEPGESQDDELFLFHADALAGPWRPHPRNPIVSDVRGARPAGPIIRDGERLLRPAQDCSGRYGRAVVFKQVLELSGERYREVEVARLEPDWLARNLATHHYATDERWAAIDALRRRRRW